MRTQIVTAAFALAAWAATADAATIVVSKTGAITSIQAGVNAAGAGDTVLVKTGTYAEVVDLPANKPGLILKGVGNVILDARGPAGAPLGRALDVFADDAVVSGLTIRNAAQLGLAPGTGVFVTGARSRIEHCAVIGCEDFGIHVIATSDVTIENCVVRGCGDGLFLDQAIRARVSQTTFDSTVSSSIELDSDVDTTIEKVLIRNNSNGASIRTAAGSSDGLAIVKCKIFGAGDAAMDVTGANVRIADNVVRNSAGGIVVDGVGAVIEDNVLASFIDGSNGIELAQCAGGRVEGNVVRDVSAAGIRIDGNVTNTVVRDNLVLRQGTGDSAYVISGSNIELDGCVAIEAAFGGFDIEGDQVTLTNCLAKDCAHDGFHVDGTADATSFVECRALRCDAEGFDNGGTNTVLDDCVAQQNRLDVVSDGTFAQFDITFVTGGQNVPPELD